MKKYWAILFSGFILLTFFVTATVSAGEKAGDTDAFASMMGHGEAEDIIVAKVNGRDINMAQLMEKMMDLAQEGYGRREITPLLAQKIKDEAMQKLIDEELAFQHASKTVHIGDKKVAEVVKAKIKALGGKDKIKNEEEFKRSIKRFLTVKQYIQENINSKIKISDSDLKAAYEIAKTEYFHKDENVQVTKITFFVNPSKAGSLQMVQKVRDEIVNKLNNQVDKLKIDGTFIVQKNIHLSKVKDKELFEVARKMGKFEVSEPVRMNNTLYLVQLTGYRPAVQKTFADVRDYLFNKLFNLKQKDLLGKWMKSIRHGANIEIVDLMS